MAPLLSKKKSFKRQRYRPVIVILATAPFVCVLLAMWKTATLSTIPTHHSTPPLPGASMGEGSDTAGDDVFSVLWGNHLNYYTSQQHVPRRIQETCDMVDPGFVCAPWLNQSQRIIVFNTPMGRFQTWSLFYQGQGYLGGEAYWAAGLAALLESLDFTIVRWTNTNNNNNNNDFEHNIQWGSDAALEPHVYRIISDNDGEYTKEALYNPHVMCKVRQMQWWFKDDPLQEHCILSPFQHPTQQPEPEPEQPQQQPSRRKFQGIFLPFLIHSQVLPLPARRIPRTSTTTQSRQSHVPLQQQPNNQSMASSVPRYTKNVFLLSKRCDFNGNIIRELSLLGLRIHATCFIRDKDSKTLSPDLYRLIYNHGKLTPWQFRKLMHQMDIVIGFGKPKASPTPFEAVANGAVFLNPLFPGKHNKSQNEGLRALVGEPHVYHYHLSHQPNETVHNLLQAVHAALEHPPPRPGQGYIPPHYSVCTLRKYVCQVLIEDNTPCERGQVCLARGSQDAGLNKAKYKDDLAVLLSKQKQEAQTNAAAAAATQ